MSEQVLRRIRKAVNEIIGEAAKQTKTEARMMAKERIRFKVGDLVQLNKFWENRVGIVRADDKAWWVIRGHFDIANCICGPDAVVKVIERQVVPAKYIRFLW